MSFFLYAFRLSVISFFPLVSAYVLSLFIYFIRYVFR